MVSGTAVAVSDRVRAVRDLCIASVCSTPRPAEPGDASPPRTYATCEDWALHALLPGGKWLRSQLALGAFEGLAPAPRPETQQLAVALGAALELFHTFALVHDDIMDRADTRRGKAAVHVAATRCYLEPDGGGGAELFGQASAILTGDLLFSRAWGLVHRVAREVPDVVDLWSRMCEDVVAGQMLEISATTVTRADLDPSVALEVIDLKTGRYTFSYPLRMAALLAGHPAESAVSRDLMQAGVDIGRAFQLQDDLLDVYGDPAVTGKPAGADVLLGKPTLFRTMCLQRMVAQGRPVGEALADFSSSLERAARIGVETGVRADLEDQVATCFDVGRARAAALPWAADGLQLFHTLIDTLRDRSW